MWSQRTNRQTLGGGGGMTLELQYTHPYTYIGIEWGGVYLSENVVQVLMMDVLPIPTFNNRWLTFSF